MSFGLHHIESASFVKGREFHNSLRKVLFYEYQLCSSPLLSNYTWLFKSEKNS